MPEVQVQRRLVKSTPELWAEISDIGSLAKHLDEFGEIRITRTEPETTVAWEGDAVSGTVEIEGSGWGTRVVITVEEPAAETPPPPDPAPPVPGPDEPVPVPRPEPSAPAAEMPEPQREPERVTTAPRAAARPKKRGFLARLLGGGSPEPAPTFRPVDFSPSCEGKVDSVAEPAAPKPAPAPAETAAAAPAIPAFDADHTANILEGVLDDLGAAHHRPFSRS